MSDCCKNTQDSKTESSESTSARRHTCPVNGISYAQVRYQTLLHHLKSVWRSAPKPQCYYFCTDPECEVVYFGEDNNCFTTAQLRSTVTCKSKDEDTLVCYCFGISKAEAASNPQARQFVIRQTQSGNCSCVTANPSGRCCLKDF